MITYCFSNKSYKRLFSLFIICSGILLIGSCTQQTINKKTIASYTNTQKTIDTTQKVVWVTLDGLRWQELFTGADSLLIGNTDYVKDTLQLKKDFWKNSDTERREILMPFFWNTIASKGSIYGNRKYKNHVNLTNNHWFSYPGYNEILCGFTDDNRINSNDKQPNPNTTLLEFLNNQEDFKGKVAAFGSWDVFPYIINTERSGIPVNAGFEIAKDSLTVKEKFLNKLQQETPSPWHSVRLDVFTHNYALEYFRKKHPKLTYIAYGETDDFAHEGKYDQYLHAARRTDHFIRELWNYLQSDEFYKDHTTLIITTDHGRGTTPLETWKHHGNSIDGADQVWLAIIGPSVGVKGEVKDKQQLYTNQIAATVALLLNKTYVEKAGKPINLIKSDQ